MGTVLQSRKKHTVIYISKGTFEVAYNCQFELLRNSNASRETRLSSLYYLATWSDPLCVDTAGSALIRSLNSPAHLILGKSVSTYLLYWSFISITNILAFAAVRGSSTLVYITGLFESSVFIIIMDRWRILTDRKVILFIGSRYTPWTWSFVAGEPCDNLRQIANLFFKSHQVGLWCRIQVNFADAASR